MILGCEHKQMSVTFTPCLLSPVVVEVEFEVFMEIIIGKHDCCNQSFLLETW